MLERVTSAEIDQGFPRLLDSLPPHSALPGAEPLPSFQDVDLEGEGEEEGEDGRGFQTSLP